LGKTKTIVLSTHIMQEVEAVCSQVIIINKGKIVANDSLDDLRNKNSGKSLENIFIELTNR
jgi:ABC-2 type transport system ATP-binding protein